MTGEREGTPRLEPCPFCGGRAELFYGRPGCPDKGCAGHQFYEDDGAVNVETWNRRGKKEKPLSPIVEIAAWTIVGLTVAASVLLMVVAVRGW